MMRVEYAASIDPVPTRPGQGFCRLMLCASLALCACQANTTVHVPWPEDAPLISFILRTQGEASPEIQGPFVNSAGELPKVEFSDVEGVDSYLLSMTESSLRAAFPRVREPFDPTATRLQTTAVNCEGGRFESSDGGDSRAISASMLAPELRRLEGEEGMWIEARGDELVGSLELVALEDLSRCAPGLIDPKLEPFGARAMLMEDVRSLAGRTIPTRKIEFGRRFDVEFHSVVWLDDDVVVTNTRNGIFRIERGGEIDDGPTGYRGIAAELSPPEDPIAFTLDQIVSDPRPWPDGRQHLLLMTVLTRKPSGEATSIVGETSWAEDGFSAPTVLWQGPDGIRHMTFDANGRGFVVGEDGILLILDPDPGTEIVERRLANGIPAFERFDFTGDPERPHLLTTSQNSFYLGNAVDDTLEFIGSPEMYVSSPSTIALRSAPSGLSILSSVYSVGMLHWARATGWERATFNLPRSTSACLRKLDECGRTQPLGIATGLYAHPDGWFMAAMDECDAVFFMDVPSGCGRAALIEGSDKAQITAEHHFRSLSVRGRRALVSGDEGRLLEIALP